MEGADEVYVSAASIWEIPIKTRPRKIEANINDLVNATEASGFIELPVRGIHAAGVAALPLHHTDPLTAC
jgi:PIN domain nuclease of toxin-antitoxin system